MEVAQQAHNLKTTSYQRRCDVITSHRRRYGVVLTSRACWCTLVIRSDLVIQSDPVSILQSLTVKYLVPPQGLGNMGKWHLFQVNKSHNAKSCSGGGGWGVGGNVGEQRSLSSTLNKKSSLF